MMSQQNNRQSARIAREPGPEFRKGNPRLAPKTKLISTHEVKDILRETAEQMIERGIRNMLNKDSTLITKLQEERQKREGTRGEQEPENPPQNNERVEDHPVTLKPTSPRPLQIELMRKR